jgi:hypothetical protein
VKVTPPAVIVPTRSAPVLLVAALNVNGAVPVPGDPPMTVSQSVLFETAVHEHAAPVVTVTLPVPPAALSVWVWGLSANVHGAGWFTVSVWPPMVTVPLRAEPAFAAAVIRTVPGPLPDDPSATVIQSVLFETAVHAHPAVVVTLVVASPPPAGTSTEGGVSVNAHGAAACITVNVRPAIATVPVRAAPGLLDTLRVTEPAPMPVAPAATVIHDAVVAAVQLHDAPADTVTAVGPPAAGIDAFDGSIE